MKKNPLYSEVFRRILFVTYVILLSWIILLKMQISLTSVIHEQRQWNFIPFAESYSAGEVFLNFAAFVPLGIYLAMLFPALPTMRKFLLMAGLSLFYEIVQLVFAIGIFDITDLLTNTLGGLAGVWLYGLLRKWWKDKCAPICTLLATIATGILLMLILILTLANV